MVTWEWVDDNMWEIINKKAIFVRWIAMRSSGQRPEASNWRVTWAGMGREGSAGGRMEV